MDIVINEGFDFSFDPAACTGCPGYCCCGESGRVWVGQLEIEQISSFLKINSIDFINKYLNRSDSRLTIREHLTEKGHECIFFNGPKSKCSIYEVRPLQCRKFPFWDNFRKKKNQLIRECPGVKTMIPE